MAAIRKLPILAATVSTLALSLAGVAFSIEAASQPRQLARLEKGHRSVKKASKQK